MLADPTDSTGAKKALVRTYDPPGYADPWDCVQDYERVQRAAAEHPNKGSQALSSVVELPRSRIRPWLDGAQPDCYRGLQTALNRGWILDSWSSDAARTLNRLAAWLLASGSVSHQTRVPDFVVETSAQEDRLLGYFETFDLRPRVVTRDGKPDEWIPRSDASILGRVLQTWTGLDGDKTSLDTRFPEYLQYAPVGIARGFAETYVSLRATVRTDRGDRLQIQAERSEYFRQQLIELLSRVVDPDEIRGDSWPVYLVDDAAFQLFNPDLAGYEADDVFSQ
ncbi:hypothetical protein [Natronomonas amylolytica]|uniref:hypothetical protein n=1 Tax=Natronomonas amylolytica TaxID=3108498 RepID=UPI0030089294